MVDREPQHLQTWVKCNELIDEGIAELVAALNEVEGLQTVSCCQGWPGDNGDAHVYLHYGGWEQISRFVFGEVTPALQGMSGAGVSVQVVSGREPMGKLGIKAEALPKVTAALVAMLRARESESEARVAPGEG